MKFYIQTYGCQANKSDSEIITGILKSKKHTQAKDPKKAQVLIFNTCYVKQSTQNRIINKLKQLKNSKKLIIIAGCMPEIEPKRIKQILPNSILVSARQVHKIEEAIKQKKDFLGKSDIDKTSLPKSPLHQHTKRSAGGLFPKDLTKGFSIQISEGCTNTCSYCAAKLARGNIHSFPQEEILKELQQALKAGYKTIYLTCQDTAAYGLDKNHSPQLPELLKNLTNTPGDFQMRVGMMHPSNTLPILNQLIKIFKSPKIKPFLHLPIQSGSNKILKQMNRKYKVNHCIKIIKKFRKNIPNITISTDIIVGYPTETRRDFKKTLKLIKKIKPEVLNISRYSKRPNTPDAKKNLKLLPTQELKYRSKTLKNLYDSYSTNSASQKSS